jgi:hypothetical protein
VNTADFLGRLDTIPAAQPPGLALILELEHASRFDSPDQDQARLAALIERQEEIDRALCLLSGYTHDVQKVIERCLTCPPIPASTPPTGF